MGRVTRIVSTGAIKSVILDIIWFIAAAITFFMVIKLVGVNIPWALSMNYENMLYIAGTWWLLSR